LAAWLIHEPGQKSWGGGRGEGVKEYFYGGGTVGKKLKICAMRENEKKNIFLKTKSTFYDLYHASIIKKCEYF
jgi:hypothetical protein